MDNKNMRGQPNEDKYPLVILFILALIIRLLVFFQGGNHPGDGIYRIIMAINWLKEPHFIFGDLWPPLYLYLTALPIAILDNPDLSTRLISLIFGTLIVFPYYYTIKLLFDRRVAIISTLILTFLSIHVQYSTYSMSEVPFIFFLVTSLYFFFRFKKNIGKRFTNLIISAIFLNVSSMIRYEAWLFIPLLTVLILNKEDINKIIHLRKDTVAYVIVFFIISLIFPISWMIGNYSTYGDFFYGQTWSDNYIRANAVLNPDSSYYNPSFIDRLITWPKDIFVTLNIVSIFAIIGILASLVKRRNMEFLSIFIILMLIFIYKLTNSTMTPQIRHMMTPIIFLIPYFTSGLDYTLRFTYNDMNKVITVIVIGLFIMTSSYNSIAKNPYVTPNYVTDVAGWLKTNVKTNDTVLLDDYNWWSLHILLYSGLNTTFTEDYLKTFEFTTKQMKIVPGGGKKVDELTVINYLRSNPTYVIYSPKGILARTLRFSPKCQNEKYLNYSFGCVYTTENYNIYRLNNESIERVL